MNRTWNLFFNRKRSYHWSRKSPFLPSSSLMCCAILLRSFGKGTSFEVMTCRTAFMQFPNWNFPFFSRFRKVNAWISLHRPRFHLLYSFLSDRRDWYDTRRKWLLASNLGKGWWHCQITKATFILFFYELNN